jgi:hypothetical protein
VISMVLRRPWKAVGAWLILDVPATLAAMHEHGYALAPARSPLPTDWEPSEQDARDYSESKGWDPLSTYYHSHARAGLMLAHRHGWDARPSRIGGTP